MGGRKLVYVQFNVCPHCLSPLQNIDLPSHRTSTLATRSLHFGIIFAPFVGYPSVPLAQVRTPSRISPGYSTDEAVSFKADIFESDGEAEGFLGNIVEATFIPPSGKL